MTNEPISFFSRIALIIDQRTQPPSKDSAKIQKRIAHALCAEQAGEHLCTENSARGEWLRSGYRRLTQWIPPRIFAQDSTACTIAGNIEQCDTVRFASSKHYTMRCGESGICELTHSITYGAMRAAGVTCASAKPKTFESEPVTFTDPLAHKADLAPSAPPAQPMTDEHGVQGWRFDMADTALQPSCHDYAANPEHPLADNVAERVYIRGISHMNGQSVMSVTNADPEDAHGTLIRHLLELRGYYSIGTFAPKHWKYVHAHIAMQSHPQDGGEVHWHSQYTNSWDESFVSILASPTTYSATLVYHHQEHDCWAVYRKMPTLMAHVE